MLFILIYNNFYTLCFFYYFIWSSNVWNLEIFPEWNEDEDEFFLHEWKKVGDLFIKEKYGVDIDETYLFEMQQEIRVGNVDLLGSDIEFSVCLEWYYYQFEILFNKIQFVFLFWFKQGYELNCDRFRLGGVIHTQHMCKILWI